MPKITNADIINMALVRFLRTSGALVIGVLIPILIEVLGQIEVPEDIRWTITTIAVPSLMALNKYAREKGWSIVGV